MYSVRNSNHIIRQVLTTQPIDMGLSYYLYLLCYVILAADLCLYLLWRIYYSLFMTSLRGVILLTYIA